jgi:hypothetical protein
MDRKLSNSSIVSRIAPGDMPGTSDNGVCMRQAKHDKLASRKLMFTASDGTHVRRAIALPPKKRMGKRM